MMRELTPDEIKQRKEERDALEIPYRNAVIKEILLNMVVPALLAMLLVIICRH